MKLTDQDILNILLKVYNHFGYIPFNQEYDQFAKENNLPSRHVIKGHTGKTFSYHVRVSKFPRKGEFTKQQIIDALLKASKSYGGNIQRRQYDEWHKQNKDKPSGTDIRNTFGTFNNAKVAAGLSIRTARQIVTEKDCVNALLKCAKDLNVKIFTEEEYEAWRDRGNQEYPAANTVRAKLGKFREALEKVGLQGKYELHDEKYKHAMLGGYIQHILAPSTFDKWAKENGYPGRKFFIQYGLDFQEELKKHLLMISKNCN
jgi:hypothetical protein